MHPSLFTDTKIHMTTLSLLLDAFWKLPVTHKPR
jgi:hypothetical protein